jgi:RNA polymerase sigma-70 factor (ECF subfamily)
MSQGGSFDDLLTRLRTGDDEAARAIFDRFANRLIGVARMRLGQRFRPKLDPEDVVQSVYKSFFVRFAEGQFDLKSWDNLWALLTVLTIRKCGHRIEYFQAARRDIRGEVSPRPTNDSWHSWEALAREPTPVEAALLTEVVEQLMRTLELRHQEIVALTLQGLTVTEVSAQVGCSERTVRRVLEQVRNWLQRRQLTETQES